MSVAPRVKREERWARVSVPPRTGGEERRLMSMPPGIGRKEKGLGIRRRQGWEEWSRRRGIPLLRGWEGRNESVSAVRIDDRGVERTRRVLPSTTRR
eukprot:163586-Rhodomonas_salina.1